MENTQQPGTYESMSCYYKVPDAPGKVDATVKNWLGPKTLSNQNVGTLTPSKQLPEMQTEGPWTKAADNSFYVFVKGEQNLALANCGAQLSLDGLSDENGHIKWKIGFEGVAEAGYRIYSSRGKLTSFENKKP